MLDVLVTAVTGTRDQRGEDQTAGDAGHDRPAQTSADVENGRTVKHAESKSPGVGDVGHVHSPRVGHQDAEHKPCKQDERGLVIADGFQLSAEPAADPQYAEQPVDDPRQPHDHDRLVASVASDHVLGHHRDVAQQQDQPQGAIRAQPVLQGGPEDYQPVDVEHCVDRVGVHQGAGEGPPQLARPDPRQDAQKLVIVHQPPGVVDPADDLQGHGHGRGDQRHGGALEVDFGLRQHGPTLAYRGGKSNCNHGLRRQRADLQGRRHWRRRPPHRYNRA